MECDDDQERPSTPMEDGSGDDEGWVQVFSPPTTVLLRTQNALTYCHACGVQGRKVRKCSGCSVACYCSKECQKSAWPIHKKWCRPRGPETAPEEFTDPLGPEYKLLSLAESPFSTKIAAADSFGKFVKHHYVALMLIKDCAAYLLADGGHFDELSAGVPHVAVFHMVPRHGEVDPGKSWALKTFGIRPVEHWIRQYPGLEPGLSNTLEAHRVIAEAHKNELGSRYCATLIHAYHLIDGIVDIEQKAVPALRDSAKLAEQPMPDALRDFAQLCLFAINRDVLLPKPSLEEKIFVVSAAEEVHSRRGSARKFGRATRTLETIYNRLIRAGYTPRSTVSPTQMMKSLADINGVPGVGDHGAGDSRAVVPRSRPSRTTSSRV